MKRLNRTCVAALAVFGAVAGLCLACAGEEITSPDKSIVLRTSNQGGSISYSVDFKDGKLIAESPLGLALKSGAFFGPLKVVDSTRSSHDSTWETVMFYRTTKAFLD